MRERVGNGRQYVIEWADQSVQLQVQTVIRFSYSYAQEASLSQGIQIMWQMSGGHQTTSKQGSVILSSY